MMMNSSFRIRTQNGNAPHRSISAERKRFGGGVILAQAWMEDDDTRNVEDDWMAAQQRDRAEENCVARENPRIRIPYAPILRIGSSGRQGRMFPF